MTTIWPKAKTKTKSKPVVHDWFIMGVTKMHFLTRSLKEWEQEGCEVFAVYPDTSSDATYEYEVILRRLKK